MKVFREVCLRHREDRRTRGHGNRFWKEIKLRKRDDRKYNLLQITGIFYLLTDCEKATSVDMFKYTTDKYSIMPGNVDLAHDYIFTNYI